MNSKKIFISLLTICGITTTQNKKIEVFNDNANTDIYQIESINTQDMLRGEEWNVVCMKCEEGS